MFQAPQAAYASLCWGHSGGVDVFQLPTKPKQCVTSPPNESSVPFLSNLPLMASTRTAAAAAHSSTPYRCALMGSVTLVRQLAGSPLIAVVASFLSPPQPSTSLLHQRGGSNGRGRTGAPPTATAIPLPPTTVVSGSDRTVTLYSLSNFQALAEIHCETKVLNVEINAQCLAVVLERRTYLYALDTWSLICCMQTTAPLNRLGIGALSAVVPIIENSYFAYPSQKATFRCVSSDDPTVRSFAFSSAKSRTSMIGGAGPRVAPLSASVAHFSAGGTGGDDESAMADGSGSLVLLSAPDGACIATVQVHKHPIAAIAFSPAGSRLATCSTQGTNILVLSVPSLQTLYVLRRGQRPATIRSMKFGGRQSELLAAASDYSTIHLFRLRDPSHHGERGSAAAATDVSSSVQQAAGQLSLSHESDSSVVQQQLKQQEHDGPVVATALTSAARRVAFRLAAFHEKTGGGIRSFAKVFLVDPTQRVIDLHIAESGKLMNVLVSRSGKGANETGENATGQKDQQLQCHDQQQCHVVATYVVEEGAEGCRLLREFPLNTT